jgi:hypothetical protein
MLACRTHFVRLLGWENGLPTGLCRTKQGHPFLETNSNSVFQYSSVCLEQRECCDLF